MNETELRQIYASIGMRFPRTAQIEAIDINNSTPVTNQNGIRLSTQQFVQAHWTFLQHQLSCQGNCGDAINICSDAQAATCYLMNKDEIENFIKPEKGKGKK